jgi:hypothetical protein
MLLQKPVVAATLEATATALMRQPGQAVPAA